KQVSGGRRDTAQRIGDRDEVLPELLPVGGRETGKDAVHVEPLQESPHGVRHDVHELASELHGLAEELGEPLARAPRARLHVALAERERVYDLTKRLAEALAEGDNRGHE